MNNSSKPLAVGVIGVGGMGGRHAVNLHSQVFGAEVVAVMDMDSERASAVAADCGSARTFSDGHKLIEDPSVDAVVIASPDPTHVEFTLACLAANKPVFCEKPLAVTAEDAQRVVDAEVELGRRLVQVGFMRHYDAQHVAVKQAVDAGRVGRPILFKGFHRNEEHEPYVTGEGVIVNSAIHDLDSCRWFLGQEVEQVYVGGVTTDAAVGEDTFDLVAIHLSLTGGCLGMIETYVNAGYGYEVGVEVVGETGTVQTDPSEGPVVRSGAIGIASGAAGLAGALRGGVCNRIEGMGALARRGWPHGAERLGRLYVAVGRGSVYPVDAFGKRGEGLGRG